MWTGGDKSGAGSIEISTILNQNKPKYIPYEFVDAKYDIRFL